MRNAIRVPIGIILVLTTFVMLFLFFMFKGLERVTQLLADACGSIIESCEAVCSMLDEWGE